MGLKLGYLRGFLSSDSAKCCKLQHFVRCLCAIFKRAMLSHVLCILPQETTLQIETGRQRDPKESWREETHRSFYTHRGFYTEKSLHKGDFYIQNVLHREVFTLRSFCRQTSRSFYTQKFLHEEVFTQRVLFAHRSFYTQRSVYTQKLLHTKRLLHREACTQRSFLHTESFTQRSLSSKGLLHTNVSELLHTKAVTQRSLYSFNTQTRLHTETFTQKSLYTESV